jgi:hypothetical protein
MHRPSRLSALLALLLVGNQSLAASATGTITVTVLRPLSVAVDDINFGRVRQGNSAALQSRLALRAPRGQEVSLSSSHDCDPALGLRLETPQRVLGSGGEQSIDLRASLQPQTDAATLGQQRCSFTITATYP